MSRPEPVPFRVVLPRRDTLDLDGARSVSYRGDGLLHLQDHILTLEWAGTERTQRVAFTGIRTTSDVLPVELLDVPVSWLAEARLTGGWWAPRLRLRARRLDAFDGVPGAQPGTIVLPIRRRHRALAAALLAAMAEAMEGGLVEGTEQLELDQGAWDTSDEN
jgi:hypothetical protein